MNLLICLGYKGYVIKEYFMNYFLHNSDLSIDLHDNRVTVHDTKSENFKVTLSINWLETMTAGRLKRVQQYVDKEDFMLTYGDGVASIDINKLVEYHKQKNKICHHDRHTTRQQVWHYGTGC